MVENLVDYGILLMTCFCHSASFMVCSYLGYFFFAGAEFFLATFCCSDFIFLRFWDGLEMVLAFCFGVQVLLKLSSWT